MALVLRGVRVLVLFVLFVFTKSDVLLYTYYLIPGTHFYLDKKNRRTQYHLSRNRAVLLVVCSVLNFSSRIIRALLYSSITSSE